mgnify:FL=1
MSEDFRVEMSKPLPNVLIRVDNRLAGVLDVPQNSRLSLMDVVTHLIEYVAKRKLHDPESNQRDDWDPDRHLDSTVSLGEDGGIHCERCWHNVNFYERKCNRCGLPLKLNDWGRAVLFLIVNAFRGMENPK